MNVVVDGHVKSLDEEDVVAMSSLIKKLDDLIRDALDCEGTDHLLPKYQDIVDEIDVYTWT